MTERTTLRAIRSELRPIIITKPRLAASTEASGRVVSGPK
jgi:hypothetical protein